MKVLSLFPDDRNKTFLLDGSEQVPNLVVEWVVLLNDPFQSLLDDCQREGPPRRRQFGRELKGISHWPSD